MFIKKKLQPIKLRRVSLLTKINLFFNAVVPEWLRFINMNSLKAMFKEPLVMQIALLICITILENMGGDLWITSNALPEKFWVCHWVRDSSILHDLSNGDSRKIKNSSIIWKNTKGLFISFYLFFTYAIHSCLLFF